jgi:hypothetical protein
VPAAKYVTNISTAALLIMTSSVGHAAQEPDHHNNHYYSLRHTIDSTVSSTAPSCREGLPEKLGSGSRA